MSEVIATVVLIIASVILGGVAYVWASSASVASQNNLGQAAHHDVNAVSERFEILATNFTYSGSTWTKAQIYVYNSGIVNTTIVSIFDNSTSMRVTQTAIFPGQMVIITATPSAAQAKTPVLFKAVGYYGFYATYLVQP